MATTKIVFWICGDQIRSLLFYRLFNKREGDYWDFKERYHSNKVDLLHDIICMANNRADRDGYIIFGVRDDYEKRASKMMKIVKISRI